MNVSVEVLARDPRVQLGAVAEVDMPDDVSLGDFLARVEGVVRARAGAACNVTVGRYTIQVRQNGAVVMPLPPREAMRLCVTCHTNPVDVDSDVCTGCPEPM